MRRSYLVGVVVVVLAIVLVWRFGCRSSGELSGDSTSETAGSDSAGSGARKGFGPRGARATPAALSGRVTRQRDAKGIPGAVVAFAKAELGAMFQPDPEPTTIAVTDANGAWSVAALQPGTYHVSASATGFLPGVREKFVVSAAARETIDLALAEGGNALTGMVIDVGGGPIGGARVTARSENKIFSAPAEYVALTTADGKYHLTIPDSAYSAKAAHEDYTDVTHRFQLQGDALELDFRLVPGGQIRGQVVARDGTPVPGAMVSARNTGGGARGREAPAFTDDTGTFALTGLDSGAIALTAAARGYASQSPTVVELGIGEDVSGVRVVVDKALTVSGRVVRAGKTTEGIPGVNLGVFTMDGKFAIAIDPTADDGSFEIVGVQPASYMVFALGEGSVPEIGKQVDVVDKDVTGVVIELEAGVTLAGRVEPGAVAALSIEPKTDRVGLDNIFSMLKAAVVRADSDETGVFTLRAVPAGSFTLVAKTADGSTGKLPIEVADKDQTGLVVKLEKRASIAGKVIDDRGKPVSGMRVTAIAQNPKERGMTMRVDGDDSGAITGTSGTFKVVGLEPGTYEMRAHEGQDWFPRAGDDAKPRVTVEVAAGEAKAGITITVESRDGVIRGLVVDKTNKPVPDAWVSATFTGTDGDDKTVKVYGGMSSRSAAVLSDRDGKFVIERLKRGTHSLEVEGPKGASRATKGGVKTGDNVTITLDPLATLSGRVTLGSAPVAAYDLSCRGERFDGENASRRFVKPDGTYLLERLAPGEYTCTASADTGHATDKVTVTTGPAKLDLALAAWGTVTGQVVSVVDGKPLAGLSVAVSSEGSDTFKDLFMGKAPTTDASGRFVVDRVAAGKIELRILNKANAFDHLTKKELTITPGQRLDAGVIKIVPPRDAADAGTLGFTTSIDDDKLLVGVVKDDSPAAKANVAMGDRILAIDGKPVAQLGTETAQQLIAPGAVGIGQRVQLALERDGKPFTAAVVAVKW